MDLRRKTNPHTRLRLVQSSPSDGSQKVDNPPYQAQTCSKFTLRWISEGRQTPIPGSDLIKVHPQMDLRRKTNPHTRLRLVQSSPSDGSQKVDNPPIPGSDLFKVHPQMDLRRYYLKIKSPNKILFVVLLLILNNCLTILEEYRHIFSP